MLKWLKEIFSSKEKTDPVIVKPAPVEEAPKIEQAKPVAKPKTQAKKPATKAEKVDVDNMSKKDLLAHAKKNGIKANASMNKDALVKAIKNG